MSPYRMRRNRNRGHAIIEMALGIMPYFVILFGIVDFSMVVFLRSMNQHAAREGVRQAVTYSMNYNGQTCTSQTECIKLVAVNHGMGFLTADKIHVKYYAPDNLTTPLTAGDLPHDMGVLGTVNFLNQTGNVIEVVVELPFTWMVPLQMSNSGALLRASASDVLQSLPLGTFSPPAP